MPFREPRRLPKRFPLSRFKNVLETDDFRLQKRRKRTFATHKYRIILVVPRAGVVSRLTGRRLPVYELAHSNDLDELRTREWTFLCESVDARTKWIKAISMLAGCSASTEVCRHTTRRSLRPQRAKR